MNGKYLFDMSYVPKYREVTGTRQTTWT